MIIRQAATLDYEPLTFFLLPAPGAELPLDSVEHRIAGWLRDRRDRQPCPNGCTQKFLAVLPHTDAPRIHVMLQWTCLICLPSLFVHLEQNFPQLTEIQIGHDASPPPPPAAQAPSLLEIAERTVTFEDDRSELVVAFTITRRPISVAQYAAFCTETGYKTVLERRNHRVNYRKNPMTQSESDEAGMLAYEDAAAYCRHRNVRLPTEAEFFAAALIDDQVHDLNGWEVAKLARAAILLQSGAPVITATLTAAGVVIRRGPRIVKVRDWKQRPGRKIFPLDQPAGAFCVCVP